MVVLRHLELVIIGVPSVSLEKVVIVAPPEGIVKHIFVDGSAENSIVAASANYKVPFLALVEHIFNILFLVVVIDGFEVHAIFFLNKSEDLLLGALDASR